MDIPDLSGLFGSGFTILFYVLAAIFVVHAIIATYHWLTYGTSRASALLAVAIYCGGGAFLLMAMAVSLAAT